MTNRFKDPTLRNEYDNATRCFETKHRNLFCSDGSRSMGNSMASFFWRGFDGTQFGAGFTDAASKKILAYAYYRAGQDCAKAAK